MSALTAFPGEHLTWAAPAVERKGGDWLKGMLVGEISVPKDARCDSKPHAKIHSHLVPFSIGQCFFGNSFTSGARTTNGLIAGNRCGAQHLSGQRRYQIAAGSEPRLPATAELWRYQSESRTGCRPVGRWQESGLCYLTIRHKRLPQGSWTVL
jgi:hypothetical protein